MSRTHQSADSWQEIMKKRLSLTRVSGFACQRLWVFMMFYSLMPYALCPVPRTSMYQVQTISIIVFVLTCAFLVAAVRAGSRISQYKAPIFAAAAAMSASAVCAIFADSSTNMGLVLMVAAGIVSGIGSAVMFIMWLEKFFDAGSRISLVEYGMATAFALLVGFILLALPAAATWIATTACPIIGAVIMTRLSHDESRRVPVGKRLSKSTLLLFGKALTGAFLIGALEGYYDVYTGEAGFIVTDMHGVFLFLGGMFAAFIMIVIGSLGRHDTTNLMYRFSMLIMGFGFIATPIMVDSFTFIASVVFAGYMCFLILNVMICMSISKSFGTGTTRTLAAGIGTTYFGEACGFGIAEVCRIMGVPTPDIIVVDVVILVIFLLILVVLFPETDLVRAGLGEMEPIEERPFRIVHKNSTQSENCPVVSIADAAQALEEARVAAQAQDQDQPAQSQEQPEQAVEVTQSAFDRTCAQITSTYNLSPREADVLPLLLQGRTMARIQEALFISAGTVSTHTRHIYQKTGVRNRQELMDLAQNLVD